MRATRVHIFRARLWAGLSFCAAAFLSSFPCAASEPPAEPQPAGATAPDSDGAARSVDDALLQDLDNELLDGLGDIEDRPRAPRKPSPDQAPDESSLDGEDIGMPSAEEDPLGYISQEMRQVEELIPQRGKHTHAEQIQQKIVEDLAKLIEQAEQQRAQQSSQNSKRRQTARRDSVKQPQSSANTSGKNSNKPAADSTDRLGQAEQARPDPELFKGLLKDAWGHLPEREREQMLQMSRERFLPQYELLIERYYRRLAEERSK